MFLYAYLLWHMFMGLDLTHEKNKGRYVLNFVAKIECGQFKLKGGCLGTQDDRKCKKTPC